MVSITGAVGVVWVLLILGLWVWGRGERLIEPSQNVLELAELEMSLDIVVPARDESAVIGRCVRSINPGLTDNVRLWIVDDGSTDGTSAIAKAAMTSSLGCVVCAPEKPSGWSGKSWACQFGGGLGVADWILFLDADVFVDHRVFGTSVATANERDLSLLSLFGRWEIPTGWLELMLPAVGWLVRSSLDLTRHNRGQLGRAFANGQYILIKRSVWEAIGGHGAVAESVLDDVAMAIVVRKMGARNAVLWAPWAFTVLAYESVSDLFNGYRKNFFEGMGRNTPLAIIAATAVVVISAVPILVLASGVWMGDQYTIMVGLTVYGLQCVYRFLLERRDGRSGIVAPLHWLAGLFIAAILVASTISRTVIWKGRVFERGVAQ